MLSVGTTCPSSYQVVSSIEAIVLTSVLMTRKHAIPSATSDVSQTDILSAQVAYSDFLTLVHSGNVKTAGIDDSSDKIYFSLNGHSSQQAAEAATGEAVAPVEAAAAVALSQAEASPSTVDSNSGRLACVVTP